ncbi:MAG: pyridoxine 5'-phosphate synthase [Chitinispirillales bacterium]|jgi:pyridoxine 5-phosphate synthase|nr:pyridoxine 5'-phosphate synthase [Chitinispirillales bacterium]
MTKLGVNIDHVATLRQARGGVQPDPIHAAAIAEIAGASAITAHLREDRRHMNDRDIYLIKQMVMTSFNLEMAVTPEMVSMAVDIRPNMVTLVPEKREEKTTEGGLVIRRHEKELADMVEKMSENNILISVFIDPDFDQIKSALKIGATHVELHTGYYANAKGRAQEEELERIRDAAAFANKLGLIVNAGHGLNYQNTAPVAQIEGISELNIGHSIISRAVFIGLENAVKDMLRIINTSSLV